MESVSPSVASAVELLVQNGLPAEDVTQALLENFVGLKQSGCLIAMGGLEPLGDLGLLRSVVVCDEYRGRGIASELVRSLEKKAVGVGIEVLYLLTTDADQYFARFGFKRVDRDQVPQKIRNTNQFSELCPDTAVVMFKPIT